MVIITECHLFKKTKRNPPWNQHPSHVLLLCEAVSITTCHSQWRVSINYLMQTTFNFSRKREIFAQNEQFLVFPPFSSLNEKCLKWLEYVLIYIIFGIISHHMNIKNNIGINGLNVPISIVTWKCLNWHSIRTVTMVNIDIYYCQNDVRLHIIYRTNFIH